ncbi:hypothetical protein [Wolbachia endosymbiont of Pentidionis agamae]|uniref:hypothetical protein n=1 Tax=Wolbachia endosymbiont of Pentidionis agamae TaxID=3110435 RepID=UPI002FD791C3
MEEQTITQSLILDCVFFNEKIINALKNGIAALINKRFSIVRNDNNFGSKNAKKDRSRIKKEKI